MFWQEASDFGAPRKPSAAPVLSWGPGALEPWCSGALAPCPGALQAPPERPWRAELCPEAQFPIDFVISFRDFLGLRGSSVSHRFKNGRPSPNIVIYVAS